MKEEMKAYMKRYPYKKNYTWETCIDVISRKVLRLALESNSLKIIK